MAAVLGVLSRTGALAQGWGSLAVRTGAVFAGARVAILLVSPLRRRTGLVLFPLSVGPAALSQPTVAAWETGASSSAVRTTEKVPVPGVGSGVPVEMTP